MKSLVWFAGLSVLAGGAGCSSSTQPSELEGLTGAWVGVAPVFLPADSLALFIADSAGTVSVFGRFNSGVYQEYTYGFAPSSPTGLTIMLGSISPPFFANLNVRLEGARLVGTYNDQPVTLTRIPPPAALTGLWVETQLTGAPGPTFPTADSIWFHPDGRVHRKLQRRFDVDSECIDNAQGIPRERLGSIVLSYLFMSTGTGCYMPNPDSLIIQGATLRRRTLLVTGGILEEVYEHRQP